MEHEKNNQELTLLLEHAADGRPGAVEAFFEALLRSEVWVALQPLSPPEGLLPLPEIGRSGAEQQGFFVIDYEGKDCLMIFTEEQFVSQWAKADLPCVKKEFKSLLWMVGEETWLYLNPSQETGKEITPWEIEQMKRGPAAIPDLAAAVSDYPLEEIEVRNDPDLYPEFKSKLLPVLEMAKGLKEAFLIAVKDGETAAERPILGLRYNDEAGPADVRSYIRRELEETWGELCPDEAEAILIVDDLASKDSTNATLFDGAVPFFIGLQKLPKQSVFSKAKQSLGSLLGRSEQKASGTGTSETGSSERGSSDIEASGEDE